MSEKLRLFEMFAGYGGASFALKKAGIDFETVGFSEIDKYAIQCYNQNNTNVDSIDIHGEVDGISLIPNFGDCTKINPNDIPDFDLLTGGFSCQPYSVAGKNLGLNDLRGQVIYDVFRIVKVKQPKYILLENVKGLLSGKHSLVFEMIMEELSSLGYDVDFRLFNSKEYGIPQNRERVFIYAERQALNTLQGL